MVSARSAAMLFNRFVDWSLDQRNPRTASRHLLLSKPAIGALLGLSSALFVAAAAAINRLTFVLSPVALAIVFFYSLTKRFTAATHFFLGLALAISPIGAWIAQRGDLDLAPIVLAIGVICWVAGFDLIYATQDFEFDRREGIRSLVVAMGIARTLRVAQLLHVLMLTMLIGFGFAANLGPIYFLAMPVVAAALVYEHRSARSLDVAGINRAFFQSNAFVSALFLVVVCLDRLIGKTPVRSASWTDSSVSANGQTRRGEGSSDRLRPRSLLLAPLLPAFRRLLNSIACGVEPLKMVAWD